jgi:dTMP kinase
MTSGKLIVLEGIDGAGTTTQLARLARHYGERIYTTHEPSDGPVGMLIRQILRGEHAPFDHAALALLFAADRRDHLAREIEPKLAEGVHVVTDRYLISSLVYQGRFIDADVVRAINRGMRPADLTLFLEVPANVAAGRRETRGAPDELFDPIELQRAVAVAYSEEAARLAAEQHVQVLDGSQPPDQVFARVVASVESCIGAGGGSSSP